MLKEGHIRELLSLLLFAGIALLPVYIFSSGDIQPAHMILALFSVFLLAKRGFLTEGWSLLLLILSLHVFVVEATYSVVRGGEARGMLNAAYFFYTFLLTAAATVHTERVGLKPFYFGMLIATSIATLTVVASGVDLQDISETGRETGTFNNPNQLGFLSVCLLSSSYFLYTTKRISYFLAVILFGTALFLSIVSLSKAAMLANGVVIFFALKPRPTKVNLLVWIVGFFVAIFILSYLYNSGAFNNYLFIQRIQALSTESDSSLASRGYFTVFSAPWYQIVFGMGADNIRFAIGHEVHSTLGSALNAYGIVGFLLMFTLLASWALKIHRHFGIIGTISIVGPSMLYGITHNGSRFVFFWILFATTIGYIRRVNNASERTLSG